MKLFIVISTLLFTVAFTNSCSQLCGDCQGSTCNLCYEDFNSDADQLSQSDPCQCPPGYFTNQSNKICLFCPSRCRTCTAEDNCTACLTGYYLHDGECIKNMDTTDTIEVLLELDKQQLEEKDPPKMHLEGAGQTSSYEAYFNFSCSGMSQKFYGVKVFDYDTIILKTYYGLPYHDWAEIKIQFAAIDSWQGDDLVLEVESGKNHNSSTFTSSLLSQQYTFQSSQRDKSFCEDSFYGDNLGIINTSFIHTDSILKFKLSVNILNPDPDPIYNPDHTHHQYNLLFAIREIYLLVGICPPECKTCSSPERCGSCHQLYYLDQTTCICNETIAIKTDKGCIRKCQLDEVFIQQEMRCYPCERFIWGCDDCDSTTLTCEECQYGYFLLNGTCYHECPTGYEQSIESGEYICKQCEQNCAVCSNNECQYCVDGYFWLQGECLLDCPLGMFEDYTEETCQRCNIGCLQCHSRRHCLLCQNDTMPYKNVNGECMLVCDDGELAWPFEGCNSTCFFKCDTCFGPEEDQCLSCIFPYVLQNYSCLYSCEVGYYEQFGECLQCENHCDECNHYQCFSCSDGYWKYKSLCLKQCPVGYFYSHNGTCEKCEQGCYACFDEYLCQQCEHGWFLMHGQCYQDISCPAEYYFDHEYLRCAYCPEDCVVCEKTLCIECDTTTYLNNGECVNECPRDKYPADGKCLWKSPLCERYATDGSGQCQECTYLDPSLILNFSCYFSCHDGSMKGPTDINQCTVTCPENCIHCNTEGFCTLCQEEYTVSNGNCVDQCGEGYMNDSIQCFPCSDSCLQCQLDGVCFNCESGKVLNSNGVCVDQNCTASYKNNGICVLCYPACKTCTSLLFKCTSCHEGAYLTPSGGCTTSCPGGTFADSGSWSCRQCPPQCYECESSTQCTACDDQFYLQNGKCTLECAPGSYKQPQSQQCEPCYENCETCYGGSMDQCLTCYNDYKMDHSRCVMECPVGKYEDHYGHCDSCHYLCNRCWGPADFQCLDCLHENSFYDGYCFEECPEETYFIDGKCEVCPFGCEYCENSTCLECHDGYTLYNGVCEDYCPSGTYYNENYHNCQNCTISNCELCTSSGCSKCSEPFYRYNRECVRVCPDGTYQVDHNLRQCLNCPGYCSTCESPTSCLTCKKGYKRLNGMCFDKCDLHDYFNYASGQCQSCSDHCEVCLSSQQCQSCESSYYLLGGTCVSDCEDGYFPSTTGHCVLCPPSCLTCNSQLQCSSCQSGYILQNNLCMKDGEHHTCEDTCSLCSDNYNCLFCMVPYYLLGGSCLSDCPVGYFAYGRECHFCDSRCSECEESKTNCLSCKDGYSLYDHVCLQNCPHGFYTEENNQCELCSDNCLYCLNGTSCLMCSHHYVLFDGFCEYQCPVSYYFSPEINQCLLCEQNCSSCLHYDFCLECSPFTYLFNHTCFQNCPFGTYLTEINHCSPCQHPCSNCFNAETCLSCEPGYHLNNSACVMSCGPSLFPYYPGGGAQSICKSCSPNCLTCLTNSTTCTSCKEGFYLVGRKCVLSCPLSTYPAFDGNCRSCQAYCLHCLNHTECEFCTESMSLYEGKCIDKCPTGFAKVYYEAAIHLDNRIVNYCEKCLYPCKTCSQMSIYHCNTCQAGFYLYNSICLQVCPPGLYGEDALQLCMPCPSYCGECSAFDNCTVCLTGVNLNGQCIYSPPSCGDTCEYCENSECFKCYTGFYLRNGACISSCPDGTFSSFDECVDCPAECANCNQTHLCFECQTNYYLFHGQCLSECPQSTILIDGKCKVDPCLSYSSSSTCISCMSPYMLLDGFCITECGDGHYITGSNCQRCPYECAECQSYSNCHLCEDDYSLYMGKCMAECPTGTYEKDNVCEFCEGVCLECYDDDECLKCLPGFYLDDGQCVDICPSGYYENDEFHICEQCGTGCLSCTQEECLYCQNPLILSNGICVSQCRHGTYQITAFNMSFCQLCPDECQECENEHVCLSCVPPYFYWQNSCVRSCPPQTFISLNSNSDSCIDCPSPCQKCIDVDYCLNCEDNYYYLDGECLTACPSHYFSDDKGNCLKCDAKCAQCSGTSYSCTSCYSGMTLTDTDSCISPCELPVNYFDTVNYVCQWCSIDCYECHGPELDDCTSCNYPLVLLDGICVDYCPSHLFPSNGQCKICSSNCYTCSESSSNCTSCASPLILMDGKCLYECPFGYYSQNRQCYQCHSTCTSCHGPSSSDCQSCQSTLILMYTGKCLSECLYPMSVVDGVCDFCQLQHCYTCNGTYCLECLDDYYLYDGECLEECPWMTYEFEQSCLSCHDPNCLVCSQNGTVCYSCWGSFLEEGQCVQNCSEGYSLIYGECIEDMFICEGFTMADTAACTDQCPNTYYANGSYCQPCSYGCYFCQSEYCIQCETTFYLIDGECLTQCPSGYVPIEIDCYPCQSPCSTCAESTSQCRSCLSGYYLQNGQCLEECLPGFEKDTALGTCKRCPANCLECEGGVCTLCKNEFYYPPDCVDNNNSCSYSEYLKNSSSCYSCDSSCQTCFGPSQYDCLSCSSSSILVNGQCKSSCPNNYVAENGTCKLCSNYLSNCLECSNTSSCTKCQSSYILHQNMCVSSCSQLNNGTVIYSKLNGSCVACPSYCSVCSEGQCLSCSVSYYLFENSCVTECPSTTYQSGSKCIECSSPCVTCMSNTECLSCNSTSLLYNHECRSSCPAETYEHNGECFDCSSSKCLECQYNSTSMEQICLTCMSPYLPNNDGNCEECIDGYYFDSVCKKCDLSCTHCVSSTQCSACSSNFTYFEGECLTSCPSSYYSNGTECLPCSTHCTSCDSTECFKCAQNYVLYNNSCLSQCPDNTFQLSQTCQQCETGCAECDTDTVCTSCQSSFFLYEEDCYSNCPAGTASANGTCIECKVGCKLCSDETNTCDECKQNLYPSTDGSCVYNQSQTNCSSGQYQSGDKCLNCYFLCGQCWGGSPNQCSSCRDSTYTLTSQGSCISPCQSHYYMNQSAGTCVECPAECKECDASGCLSCYSGTVLINDNCQVACPNNTYILNQQCKTCPQYCATCTNSRHCNTCTAEGIIYYDNICYADCPIRTYNTGSDTCQQCPQQCYSCVSPTNCTICLSPYKKFNDSCIDACPTGSYNQNNICYQCQQNCTSCISDSECQSCSDPFSLYVDSCVLDCPGSMHSLDNICTNCSTGCIQCLSANYCQVCASSYLYLWVSDTNASCVTDCPSEYEILNETCIHENCINCTQCVNGICNECEDGNYLYEDGCVTSCPVTFYESDGTKTCESCIENCLQCPDDTFCSLCIDEFGYTDQTGCVEESFLEFGVLANMSGFTSNVTAITSVVYLSTSVGPVVFGQIASTYFNIEFCQFLLFHDSATGDNEEMNNFLQSLSFMAGTSNEDSSSTRRFLQTGSTDSFLQTNMFIFILIGGFLFMYLMVYILGRVLEGACVSCPRCNFYAIEICEYLQKRFKWIYFDFVVWLSYLPFLYFSVLQVQKLSFETALYGISSILSIIILATYPLYPIFICYHLKKNYKAICLENDKMVQMSLSPYINKVKRPSELPDEDSFKYCSKDNFILLYYPLKYFRKFIFVLILATVTVPTISLSVLIGLNIIFIGYMAALRPRQMPYMVFDFIIEGVLLGFQVFMIIYVSVDATRVSAMSIATQAIGFITANLSIIIAIVLNLIAYYHIFKCIYDLVVILREKMQEKEKIDMKEKDQWQTEQEGQNIEDMRSVEENQFHHLQKELLRDNIKKVRNDSDDDEQIRTQNLEEDQRKITKFLDDKDLMINGIQPRRNEDIQEADINNLFNDKEMMENQMANKKIKGGDDGDHELPTIKNKNKKDKNKKKKRKQTENEVDELGYANTPAKLKRNAEDFEDQEEDVYYYQENGQKKNPSKKQIDAIKTKELKVKRGEKRDEDEYEFTSKSKKNLQPLNKQNPQLAEINTKERKGESGLSNYSEFDSNQSLMFNEKSGQNREMLDKNKKASSKKLNEASMKEREKKKVQNQFDDFMENDLDEGKTVQHQKKKIKHENENYDQMGFYENKKDRSKEDELNEGSLYQRERKSKKNLQKEEELDEAKMRERQAKKRKNKQTEAFRHNERVSDGNLYEVSRDRKSNPKYQKQEEERIRDIEMKERQRIRKQREKYDEKGDEVKEGMFKERSKKDIPKFDLHRDSGQIRQIEELQGVETEKKKKGFFSNLFGFKESSDEEQKKKQKSKTARNQLVDSSEFEDSSYNLKNKPEKIHRGKGKLELNENQKEEYEEIKRKNKESFMNPKGRKGHLKNLEEDDNFEDQRIVRPTGKGSKLSGQQDKGLNIENRSDVSDSEDFGTNRMRKRIEQNRKSRKGLINMNEKSASFDDDLEYKRPQKQAEKRNRQKKHGILKIEKDEEEVEQDLENIQL